MSKISFPVIANNTEQHSGFGSALPLEEVHITPGGNLPPVWEPLAYAKMKCTWSRWELNWKPFAQWT